ncbi:MAG: hypothetical protein QOD51_597, partial [Candidatus Eremiobacteraeota bacterium]|nr:hypothetical protein [Candidatus Eremiobacteraeota bacterium]
MKDITPRAQPRTTGVAPTRRAFPTQLVILVVAVILVVLLL